MRQIDEKESPRMTPRFLPWVIGETVVPRLIIQEEKHIRKRGEDGKFSFEFELRVSWEHKSKSFKKVVQLIHPGLRTKI